MGRIDRRDRALCGQDAGREWHAAQQAGTVSKRSAVLAHMQQQQPAPRACSLPYSTQPPNQQAPHQHLQLSHPFPCIHAHYTIQLGLSPASSCSTSASTYCTVSSLVTFFSTVRKASTYEEPDCRTRGKEALV